MNEYLPMASHSDSISILENPKEVIFPHSDSPANILRQLSTIMFIPPHSTHANFFFSMFNISGLFNHFLKGGLPVPPAKTYWMADAQSPLGIGGTLKEF